MSSYNPKIEICDVSVLKIIFKKFKLLFQDDRVILEVSVKAEPPKNILTHDEFKKKIQDWYDLAEMQYHRNKIDLAIEANAKASALCKDRSETFK